MITLYGIPNCDTVRKARRWLDGHSIDYQFHDFREQGLDEDTVSTWLDELGWETVVNRRSTTWKQLDPATRESMDRATALRCILEHPTLVKRPVLDTGHDRHLGFSETQYQELFTQHTL
ncbi:MAG: ArsC family reductase [Halieaceae bacterium]|nr:ArsC family reductase [Halieaceae bacterium]